jgi:pantoate--beta-alanine ligase
MLIFKHQSELKTALQPHHHDLGFVPTMGALHRGHLSLIQRAKAENQLVVCSIFVNPTQFNDKSDFEKYPITLAQDLELLLEAGTDIVFLPSVKEMYPKGMEENVSYPIGYLDTVLDGKFRPGHFNGVSQIVHKLLLATEPSHLYMGEKDFQQCLVVKQLIHQFNLPVKLITCPTLRESDGLAMSSRNVRLTPEERLVAPSIYASLNRIKEMSKHSSFETLQHQALAELKTKGFETEYLLLANANTLELISDFDHSIDMVVLIASKLGSVRLIDNMRI